MSAGLLPCASGKKRNYPIFKFGGYRAFPESRGCPERGHEPTPAHGLKVWFIAASLVPGNSGSPLFYAPPYLVPGGVNKRPIFLGVQSLSYIPWDVAGMTPAQYVYEIIEEMNPPDGDLRRGAEADRPHDNAASDMELSDTRPRHTFRRHGDVFGDV